MCKSHYRYFMKYGTTTPPQKERKVKTDRPPCRIEGCGAEGRSAYENICSKHYMREYRHGDSNKTAWTVRAANGSVYRRIKAPGHPLAHKDGKAWEHRVVLYDSIGAGVQQCHHCGKELVWMVPDPARNDKRLVYVDHLNSDKSDNRAENLVPSCFRCNTRRGQAERHKQLRAQGFWSGRDTVAQQGRSVSPGEFT